MPSAICAALTALDIPFATREPMSRHTTLKVGGPADVFVRARSAGEVAAMLRAAKETGTAPLILGNGSNLLVRDGGIRGLVICVGSGMAEVSREGHVLRAQAGATLGKVAQAAQAAGLSGLEALSGIPGTIGGAAWMNAGAYGAEMAQLVSRVHALDQNGNAMELSGEALAYGYRESALKQNGWTVTEVWLALAEKPPDAILSSMRAYAEKRREKQPLILPSAGSFFKRPEGHFAGALIERAGMKGQSVGGAMVSEKHAGFLVNTGGATAKDFLDLAKRVQARVLETSGVALEPEVRIVGCDLSC